MFEIEKTFHFEAGHVLTQHDGKCSFPHGHSYVLQVVLRSKTLIESGPKTNMLIDFSDLSATVKPMIETYFDHCWLNDTLQSQSPTVEFIAKWIYKFLKPHLPQLYAITLYETATSRATYFEEHSPS